MSDDWQIGSMAYLRRRCAAIEGNPPSRDGCFLITLFRALFGWGVIPDQAWPNATAHSGSEPPGLDDVAKRQRMATYFRVDDVADLQSCLKLSPMFAVHAAFPVTHDWFYAHGGNIDFPSQSAPVIGTHVVVLEEFLAGEQRIRFWNSWREWGSRGYGTMPVGFLKAALKEAWTGYMVPPSLPNVPGYKCISNAYQVPLGRSHVVALYNGGDDDRFAWAILLERDGALDLQDLFVKPSYRERGHSAKLVQEIRRLRRERLAGLPLLSSVHRIDADRFSVPIGKIARRLGLELRETESPWARYQAIPYVAGPSRSIVKDA